MPSTAIISGVLLILIGIIGFVFSVAGDNTSYTALIPAAFGLILAGLGFAARTANDSLRKHLMHAAVLVAFLGFIIPAGRILSQISRVVLSTAFISQVAMALICFVFVILSVKSFIAARRNSDGV